MQKVYYIASIIFIFLFSSFPLQFEDSNELFLQNQPHDNSQHNLSLSQTNIPIIPSDRSSGGWNILFDQFIYISRPNCPFSQFLDQILTGYINIQNVFPLTIHFLPNQFLDLPPPSNYR
jgi:hypothetical protein